MAAITGLHIASKLAPTINKLVFRQLLTTTVMTPILRPILLAKLRACSWRDRGLLLEALLALAAARAALLLIPFRRLTPLLGPARTQAQTVPTLTQAAHARRIGWAVAAVASRTPWRSRCLTQALAATALLRRRRIPSTLYLGVAKSAEPPQDLTAHAWVRCGEHPITGGDGQRRFTVLSTFAAHD